MQAPMAGKSWSWPVTVSNSEYCSKNESHCLKANADSNSWFTTGDSSGSLFVLKTEQVKIKPARPAGV